MNADLNDLRYLYRYGVYIGENEKKMASFLNRLTDEEIQAMADTYTEGYRIGFEVTGKDLGKSRRYSSVIRSVLSGWSVRQCAILKNEFKADYACICNITKQAV